MSSARTIIEDDDSCGGKRNEGKGQPASQSERTEKEPYVTFLADVTSGEHVRRRGEGEFFFETGQINASDRARPPANGRACACVRVRPGWLPNERTEPQGLSLTAPELSETSNSVFVRKGEAGFQKIFFHAKVFTKAKGRKGKGFLALHWYILA